MRLLGEAFPNHKKVEKIIFYVHQRFEANISAIEENDLLIVSIAKLTHKLHVQEQRDTLSGINTSE